MEQRLPIGVLPRHRHATAYAAIVLSGGYSEQGDTGRWQIEPGDVVVHQSFEAHGNVITRPGVAVVNIALAGGPDLPPVFQVADPDALIQAALAGTPDLEALLHPTSVRAPLMLDWPDALARDLRREPVQLGAWAERANLAPATVSRGFRAAFGTTAARYRTEVQTQRALRKIMAGPGPLAHIAQDCGFADQAHLSRAILRLSGRTPGAWRQVKSVQDGMIGWS